MIFYIKYKDQPRKVIIDAEDFDLVRKYKWHLLKSPGRRTYYIAAYIDGYHTRLHRLIMEAGPEDPQVDHINEKGWDCRRGNLRFITHGGNSRNRAVRKDNKLGVRGVKRIYNGKFQMRITSKGKVISKCFDTLEEASISYEKLFSDRIKREILK